MLDEKKISIFKKILEFLKKYKNKIAKLVTISDKVSCTVFFATKLLRGIEFLVTHTSTFLKGLFTSVPWLQNIFTFIDSSVTILNCLSNDKEPLHSRIAKSTVAIFRIALSILGFVALSLGLIAFGIPIMLTLISSEVVLDIYFITSELLSRFRGEWKQTLQQNKQLEEELTAIHGEYIQSYLQLKQSHLSRNATSIEQLKLHCEELKEVILKKYNSLIHADNKNTAREANLADTIHILIVSLITLIGGALLLTPAFKAGGILLIAAAIYGAVDKIELNPAKHILKLSHLNPFSEKPLKHSFEEIELILEERIANDIKNKNTTSTILKALAIKNINYHEIKPKISLIRAPEPTNKINLRADARPQSYLQPRMI